MIHTANVGLMALLSSLPGYAPLPELKAADSAYRHLLLLAAQAELAAVRMGVVGREPIAVDVYVHEVYVVEKTRTEPKTTSNRVFHALLFFDTS